MKKVLMIMMLSGLLAFTLAPVWAADSVCSTDPETKETVCSLPNPLGNNATDVPTLVGTVIKGLLGVIGGLTLLMFVWGGFQWLTSAGNAEKVKKGSNTMLWAAVGVFIVMGSYLLVSAVLQYLTKP